MAPEERIDIDAVMAEIRQKAEEELLEGANDAARRQRLRFLLENSQLSLERTPPAATGLFRRLKDAARRWVLREILQTLQPALDKQTAWNRAAAVLLHEQAAAIEDLRRRIEALQEMMPRDDEPSSEYAPEDTGPPTA